MKIAIVVQGRFHAFDLGKALLRRGHDVALFTNYPKWAVKRFGFPEQRVRSFWMHGVVSKGAFRMCQSASVRPERWLNPIFGRWAARELSKERWDVVHSWSGISEEIAANRNRTHLQLIMRGSAHIRTQDLILKQEESRTGSRLDRPNGWLQQREQREYNLADRVVVLSSFARDSFIAEGVDPQRTTLLLLGSDTKTFRPAADVIDARCRRILSGEPLRTLFVGTVCLRKGLWDIAAIARRLKQRRFLFRLVGNILPEVKRVVPELSELVELVPRQQQSKLPHWYSSSDLFLFPTLEEGFPVVLTQAHANALPILTTPNGSGPDLIRHGESGWVLPIRDPDAFVERLQWCDANRPALAEMVQRLYNSTRVRTWDDVARDFEAVCANISLQRPDQTVANG